jgi:FtsH-binding integral membrane protein
MKTNSKVLKNLGLLFIFMACLSFGYTIAREIWKMGDFNFFLIFNGIVCLLFALFMFSRAKKKKEEENINKP